MTQPRAPLVIVAALGRKTRVIGKDNQLLWHIPDDLKRFKALTLGHPVIMGRKTFESILAILGKPLPGRTNIVLTRQTNFSHPGTKVAHTLNEAIGIALEETPTEVHIGGGAALYEEALPLVSRLHLTLVDDEPEGDAFFPDFADAFKMIHQSEKRQFNNLEYQWTDWERII